MGHLRKRGSKWYCVIDIGRDENGKRRLKWYSGYPTRKAAAAAMAMLENDVHRGCYVSHSDALWESGLSAGSTTTRSRR